MPDATLGDLEELINKLDQVSDLHLRRLLELVEIAHAEIIIETQNRMGSEVRPKLTLVVDAEE